METDVYFLCHVCKGITNGTGEFGNPLKTLVLCKQCKKEFTAIKLGKLTPSHGKDLPDRYLYVEQSYGNKFLD